jgi:kynurenine formamidase
MSSSWGRWGAEDERGAANLIDEAAVRRGVGAVRSGRTLSLALPLRAGAGSGIAGRAAPQHFMTRDGGDYSAGLAEGPGFGFADGVLMVGSHGGTHIDALSHIWQDRRMYNGIPADRVTSRGAAACGIEKVGPLVTRGICVDLVPPGERALPPGALVGGEQLAAAVQRTGIEPLPGDALLMRTGWVPAWQAGEAGTTSWPGLDRDCAGYIAEHGIALIGADNLAVEGFPSSDPDCEMPLHVALLRDHGVYFCELLSLSELLAAGQPDFQLIVAPLPVVGAVGSPVNPVAVL